MAAVEPANRANDTNRQSRLRPFAWMRRLTSLKNTSNGPRSSSQKASHNKSRKAAKQESSPQPETERKQKSSSPQEITTKPDLPLTTSSVSPEPSFNVLPGNVGPDGGHEVESQPLGASNRSTAPTLDTNAGTLYSEAGQSKAETTATTAHSGGANSVFSSPNPSSRSLTTTLTTIQSTTPSGVLNQAAGGLANPTPHSNHIQPQNVNHQHTGSQSSTYFSHQYPTNPASAVPSHLTPTGAHVPTTYRSAIANNLLTDNASVLTLASSSHRHHNRRNSVDTDASVRAIAPTSLWGGSRESLPLSVLSKDTESVLATGGASQSRPSISGISEQRASVYSSGGINAPALNSERNSVYAGRSTGVSGVSSPTTPTAGTIGGGPGQKDLAAGLTDGVSVASIKSGVLGHTRQDSVGSPLVTSTTADDDSSSELANTDKQRKASVTISDF